METNFNFNSQVCTDKNQSERLLALGLKIETADCYHWQETDIYGDGNGKWHCEILSEYNKDHNEYLYNVYGVDGSDEGFFIPAWSLHRLWKLLDKIKKYEGEDELLYPRISLVDGDVIFESPKSIWVRQNFCSPKGAYENIINCFEELIKKGYFNKEYLEE